MSQHLSEEQLSGYIHHTLTDAEREAIDQHLTTCPTCRIRLDDHNGLLRRIRYDLSADLRLSHPSSQMSYKAIAPRVKRSRRFMMFVKQSNQVLYGAATIAVLVALGIGAFVLVNNLSQPPPLSTPTLPPTAAEFVLQFDGEPDRLQKPVSIDIDQQGNLYVLDQNNFRIQKFDSQGKPLTKWGTVGSGDGQFAFTPWLNGLAVDGQGNVYITDDDNHRIQKFDSNGQFLTKWGSAGTGDGEFSVPLDLAVDAQDNVYVLDWEPDQATTRVQKFDRNGNFLTKWDSRVKGWGRDLTPLIDITVDGEGNVYVSDEVLHRIQKFDSNGQLLAVIGGPGRGDGQFSAPSGIAVDGQGNLYVADRDNQRIQKFDSSGKFLFTWGSGGAGNGEFNHPADVAVDAQGNVYVVDFDNNQIQIFRQK